MSEIAAYHEAGHAYMAFTLGGELRSVTITPDANDGPAREAELEVAWPLEQYSEKQLGKNIAWVALAGPVAEMLYRSEPLHPGFVAEWRSDWQMAWQATGQIWPDQRLRLQQLEQATRQIYHSYNQEHHWAAIAAVVDSLLAHETLEGEEVNEVLRFWSQS